MATPLTTSADSDPASEIARRLGYAFQDPALLRTALTHKSVGTDNYERLEFLGDAALGFLIAQLLFEAKPDATEQQLTLMRAKLVNAASLAAVAKELRLGELLRLGLGARRSGVAESASILADTLEAVLGAVVCDGGLGAAKSVVRKAFESRLQSIGDADLKDAKTRLQEYLQGQGAELPVYTVIDMSGKDHAPVFAVDCVIAEFDVRTQGRGKSRRSAETNAAAAALRHLQTS